MARRGAAGAPQGSGGGSHWGRGCRLTAQALHDVSSLDAAQCSQEGIQCGAVLGSPAGHQGVGRISLMREGVYVLRWVTQLACQVPPGVPRRTVKQLLYLLALGRWQAAVKASVTLQGC